MSGYSPYFRPDIAPVQVGAPLLYFVLSCPDPFSRLSCLNIARTDFPSPGPRTPVPIIPAPLNSIPRLQSTILFGRGIEEVLPYVNMAQAPYG